MTNDADAPGGPDEDLEDKAIPDDAFISPDEPLVHDPFRDALIKPDDPFEPRGQETEGEDEGGVVVGMDGSTEHEASDSDGVPLDPEHVAAVLEAVAADLKEDGINGLRIGPGLSAFEKNLKKYLAEYFSNYR